jgi:hypothetical protein
VKTAASDSHNLFLFWVAILTSFQIHIQLNVHIRDLGTVHDNTSESPVLQVIYGCYMQYSFLCRMKMYLN